MIRFIFRCIWIILNILINVGLQNQATLSTGMMWRHHFNSRRKLRHIINQSINRLTAQRKTGPVKIWWIKMNSGEIHWVNKQGRGEIDPWDRMHAVYFAANNHWTFALVWNASFFLVYVSTSSHSATFFQHIQFSYFDKFISLVRLWDVVFMMLHIPFYAAVRMEQSGAACTQWTTHSPHYYTIWCPSQRHLDILLNHSTTQSKCSQKVTTDACEEYPRTTITHGVEQPLRRDVRSGPSHHFRVQSDRPDFHVDIVKPDESISFAPNFLFQGFRWP